MKEFDLNTYELNYLIDFFKNDKDLKSIKKVRSSISTLNLYQYLHLINKVIDDIKDDNNLIILLFQFDDIQNNSNTLSDDNVLSISFGSFMDYNIALKVLNDELSKFNDDYDRLIHFIKNRNIVNEIYKINYKNALQVISNLNPFFHKKDYIFKSTIFDEDGCVSLAILLEYKFGYFNQGYAAFFEYIEQYISQLSENIYDVNILDIYSNDKQILNNEKLILVLPLIVDFNHWKEIIHKKLALPNNIAVRSVILDKFKNQLKNLNLILSSERLFFDDFSSIDIKCERCIDDEYKSISLYENYLSSIIKQINKEEEKLFNIEESRPLLKLKSERIKKDLIITIINIIKDRKVNKYYKSEYDKEIEKMILFLTEPNNLNLDFDISFIEKYKLFSKVFLYAQFKKLITSNKGEVNYGLSYIFNKDKRNFETINISHIKEELVKNNGIAYYFNKYLLKLS